MKEMRIHELSFAYPGRHVFDDWSADLGPGVTWLRGGNGSGKSTLLKLLAGALTPSGGEIEVRGLRLSGDGIAYRKEVFWCGPGPVPFDHLSPAEYFGFIRGLYSRWDTAAMARHVAGFALETHLHSALRGLSTGTQRKVWLTAALSAGTSATLLDEPLNALDAASHVHLLAALAECGRDPSRLWIVASHEALGDEVRVAQRIDLASQ